MLGRCLRPIGFDAVRFDLDRVNATVISKAQRLVIGGVIIGQVLLQGIPVIIDLRRGVGRTALTSLLGSGGYHRDTSLAVNVNGLGERILIRC